MADPGGAAPGPLTDLHEFPEFDLDFEIDVNSAPMTITIRPNQTTDPEGTAWISSSVIHTVPLDEAQ